MRIEQLTFTRFLAAIAIVVFHFGKDVFPFNNSSISFLFEKANVGVSYFFILSGFVMIIAYGNKPRINSIDYLKNRVARIYPVYFIAIVLLFILYAISGAIDYKGLVFNILTIQAWIPGKALSFNPPGWSLSAEFFFYALFPFLFNFIFTKYKYKSLFLPIVLFWLVSQVIFYWVFSSNPLYDNQSKIHHLLYYFPLMHLNSFLIGNLAGLYFTNQTKLSNKNYDWPILVIFVLIIFTLKYSGWDFHGGLLAPFFVPLIILISANTGMLTKLWNKRFCIFLGEISFGIYILQIPIFDWVGSILHYLHYTNQFVKFYASLLILILSASASYIFIETPLRKKIKNIRFNTAGQKMAEQ